MNILSKRPTDSYMDSKLGFKFNAIALMLSLILVLFMHNARAAESAVTKQEIAHLFSTLEASNCQFYRNGTWHVTKDASAHLHSKYRYLQDNDLVPSAEKFIERAATESSLSGKAYQIKCADNVARPSAPWFQAALVKYRSGAKAK
jgi:Family of unknown function (DUF5329)